MARKDLSQLLCSLVFGTYVRQMGVNVPDRCWEILFARNIKGAHFGVGFDRSHHNLAKGAPL
jgi:hypothetical protein